MYLIIDSIEKGTARMETEDGKTAYMDTALLPEGAKEGDVISINIDTSETLKRENRIREKMNRLFVD